MTTQTPIRSSRNNVVFTGIDRETNQSAVPIIDDGLLCAANYVWDAELNQWVKASQAGGDSGGIVKIQDSSGNTLGSTAGALNVNVGGTVATTVGNTVSTTVGNTVSVNVANLPGSLFRTPIFTSNHIADPAPGNVIYSATVPANTQWRIKTVYVQLITDATLASRYIYCSAANASGNRIGIIYCSMAQPQNSTFGYSMASQIASDSTSRDFGFITLAIPEFILPPGGIIAIGGVNIQAADQFSNLTLGVEVTSTL